MATPLETQLQQLQQRAEAARQANARAEVQRAQAVAQYEHSLQQLAAEFPGLTSEGEAAAFLAELEAQASAEASRVSAALTAAGG